jgi:hypothetical protein
MDVDSVAGASEVHAAYIISIEVSKVVQFFVYIAPVSKRQLMGRFIWVKNDSGLGKSAAAVLRAMNCIKKSLATDVFQQSLTQVHARCNVG